MQSDSDIGGQLKSLQMNGSSHLLFWKVKIAAMVTGDRFLDIQPLNAQQNDISFNLSIPINWTH